jgi:hypothetical protein
MAFSRGLLALVGVLFIGFGGWGLIDPVAVAAMTGVKLPTPVALADGRAIYGGLTLGMGVFFLFAATRADLVRAGLWSTLLMVGGAGAGRAVGGVVDGAGAGVLPPLFFEALIAAFALIALVLLSDRRPSS